MTSKIKYECKWNPKTDITTFELAKCVPLMFKKLHEIDEWDELDESITRHFIVSKYDYGTYLQNLTNMRRVI